MKQKDETFQLYRIFCRIWVAGGRAKFSTESKEGRCSAKLEIENCLKSADEPGATRLHSAKHAQQQTTFDFLLMKNAISHNPTTT